MEPVPHETGPVSWIQHSIKSLLSDLPRRCLMRKFYPARRLILFLAFVATFAHGAPSAAAQDDPKPDEVIVDANAASHAFPHFWEQMFGSGRAVLSLRDSYRQNLREVKQITDFEYVRFHAILDDEVGVYDEDSQGRPVYNFSYVDQIYDGLLANGVKPFVELSFMPQKLAAHNILQSFWYKPNVSPPKDWDKWDDLIAAFMKHLIDRYGIDEVAQWYFEVWNEPNLDFWGGEPKQTTYSELYDHTARAIKSVNARLRVGGPASAQAAWVDAFIKHCAENNVPIDFASTHVYGNDLAKDVFGTNEEIPRDKMVCRAVSKVHRQIEASSMPTLPLIWSEFNASYKNEPEITDSTYMGPWLADTIRQCDGLVSMMSYWTFSDVFEEQGVVKTPFYGGYGLIAAADVPKPAFNAFKLLHKLGHRRIALNSDYALFTQRDDGTLVLVIWNYVPPGQTGAPKTINLHFRNATLRRAVISRVDHEHGDFHSVYEKMGSPRYPTQKQIQELRQAAEMFDPESRKLKNDELTLTLPAQGLALIELK
jgi:xylan 1,4-beta-xylosidase